MLTFAPPRLQDRDWVVPLFQAEEIPLCDYSFPALYCWHETYQQEICRWEDRLLIHLNTALGSAYLWPVGRGPVAPALAALEQDARERGQPLRFVCLPASCQSDLEALYPGRFSFTETRDAFDYLYAIDQLADLAGKKLHAKRNHIHRFDDQFPGWQFTPLTPEDLPACQALDEIWYQETLAHTEGMASLQGERRALALALQHFSDLHLEGGCIRWQGEIVAFTLGAPLTQTVYDVHFERARGDLQGAFPAINREFARWVRTTYPQIQWLNREDDMGVPGLRKAKLSYYPTRLEPNLCAEWLPRALSF